MSKFQRIKLGETELPIILNDKIPENEAHLLSIDKTGKISHVKITNLSEETKNE